MLTTYHFTTEKQRGEIYDLVRDELNRAEKLFPLWPCDDVYGVAIVTEELGESMQAALQANDQPHLLPHLEEELVHTAAMCFRQLMAMRRNR